MKRELLLCIVCVCACPLCTWADNPVFFPDVRLRDAIEDQLGIFDPSASDLLELYDLDAANRDIHDLTGLEYATNLTTLSLNYNAISDITALASLGNLEILHIDNNSASNLSALAGLTHLVTLNLHANHISDISALSGLSNLTWLKLLENNISDISPLSGLTRLEWLMLTSNDISDISPLAGLTDLRSLFLSQNNVSDVSALAGLIDLEWLYLVANQLGDITALAGLTHLAELQLTGNHIGDISPLAELMNLRNLYLDANPLGPDAYTTYLPRIVENNPGIHIRYDPYQAEYTLTIHATAGGTVTTPGVGAFGPFGYGAKVGLTAVAASGYRFVSWTGDVGTVNDTGDPMPFVTMYGDYDIQANFAIDSTCTLTVSSTRGGSVRSPGEGDLPYDCGSTVAIEAQADPFFRFDHWSGNVYSRDAATSIQVNGDCEMTAHFVSTLDVLHVDDDSPYDPAPHVSTVSDPVENGTPTHPFDSIQEAIDVADAARYATIFVRSGTYRETIEFLGKEIVVTGFDPNAHAGVIEPFPVIDGAYKGTVVTLNKGEGPQAVLSGFVITGGQGDNAGGILCVASDPTVANCLIVGNRSLQRKGSGVCCIDSHAILTNCTISANYGYEAGVGMESVGGYVTVVNSIFWDNLSDMPLAVPNDDPYPNMDVSFCHLQFGFAGNLNLDPLFVKPGKWVDPDNPAVVLDPTDPRAIWLSGDYHLKSEEGRWDPVDREWVEDTLISPCIDGGAPGHTIGLEPMPNGARINMGVYGGTAQASKTRSESGQP